MQAWGIHQITDRLAELHEDGLFGLIDHIGRLQKADRDQEGKNRGNGRLHFGVSVTGVDRGRRISKYGNGAVLPSFTTITLPMFGRID